MTTRLGQAGRWARQGLLTVGAVLGVVCILMTLGAALFGLRPLVFESGSMSPTIETGDLAISRGVDASSLEKGDIVSVPTGTGSRVTHRVVSVQQVGTDAILRLRGDANTATDATHYRVSNADRVLFHVPRLGYVVGWLSGPTGLFLLGLYAAFLLSVVFRRSPVVVQAEPAPAAPLCSEMRVIPPSSRAGRRKAPRKKRGPRMLTGGLSVVLAVGLGAGLLLERSMTPTLAAWTDGVGVSGTSLGAYTVPQPVTLSCTTGTAPGLKTVTVSWTHTAMPQSDYVVTLDNDPSNTTGSPTGTGSTRSATVSYDPSQSTYKSKTITVSVTPNLNVATSWTGPAGTATFTTAANGTPTCLDTFPPQLTITAPTATMGTTTAGMSSSVTAACANNKKFVCGTVNDASTVTVTYILQRDSVCWNGSTAYGSDCTTWRSASGSPWSASASNTTTYALVYGTPGAYTLTVRAADAKGNTTTQVVTFTLA